MGTHERKVCSLLFLLWLQSGAEHGECGVQSGIINGMWGANLGSSHIFLNATLGFDWPSAFTNIHKFVDKLRFHASRGFSWNYMESIRKHTPDLLRRWVSHDRQVAKTGAKNAKMGQNFKLKMRQSYPCLLGVAQLKAMMTPIDANGYMVKWYNG